MIFGTRVIAVACVVAATAAAVPATADAARAALDWQPCGNNARCATLTVPLDWSQPHGAQISLALSRVNAADPSKRVGTLLINPGGPGGAGAESIEYGADGLPQQLRDRFDLVGFDPRGVGHSVPAVTCSQPVFDPTVTQFPTTQAQFDQLVAHNRAVGADCLRKTGPLLAHLDTISVARDLDAIRVALGEDKLNFLGLSYGSLIGNLYARRYPQHVRAMVLDGPMDHSLGSARLVADENTTTEVSLRHFFAWCDQQTSCALHARGAEATYDELLRLTAKGPLPANGIPGGSPGEVVLQGVYEYLNVTSQWPNLATAIQQAVAGDAGLLADAADNGPDSPSDPTHVAGANTYLAIACQDFPSDVTTFGQLRQQITQAARTAPHAAGHVEAWLVQAGCTGWPVPAADPWRPEPVRGAPPILVVAGKYDLATPYSWGVGLAHQIAGSILLTRSSDGHTGLFNDPCAVQREADYLTDPAARVQPCR
ncbi:alpha/beta hydrolase [Kutzneria sp. CA-103260]|uniref:alpha/beta hydrolase n=1 Tax=Kutzneria sp. CA-103260 TaxID=2802641 RepID=UPI001BEE1B48|nr:alpha/beta hydrolase [Kutzneria sp. CA-103260]QUQ64207.1 peptidase/hydrolase [Kutzneria sp. CA-103260]